MGLKSLRMEKTMGLDAVQRLMNPRGFTEKLVSSKPEHHFTVAFAVLEVSDLLRLVTQLEQLPMIQWGASDLLCLFLSTQQLCLIMPTRMPPTQALKHIWMPAHSLDVAQTFVCVCAEASGLRCRPIPVTTASAFPLETRPRLAQLPACGLGAYSMKF